MFKNFLKIFFVLALVAVVYVINIETLFIFFLGGDVSKNVDRSPFNIPFFLIKRDLYRKPQSKWLEMIKELQTHYGYPLELENINDTDLTIKQKNKLRKNKLLTLNNDFISFNFSEDIWYSTLKDSELILKLYMSESNNVVINQQSKGLFYSIIKYMDEVSETEWQQQFNLFLEQYGVLIKRFPITELKFNQKQILNLEQGKVIGVDMNLPSFMFYKKIHNSRYVLQFKPYGKINSNIFLINNYQFIFPVILAILLAMVLLLWMRPIWRDLYKLNLVTTNFGHGDFQARSMLTKKSAIWNLSNTFNNMATRISNLITSHKDLTNAVSHELRTPLSRLRFAIEMINEEKDEELKQELVDSMGIDINELELLISELLTHARFDRENPELKYCDLEIASWLSTLIEKIKCEKNNIDLKFINSLHNKSLILEFDPKLIERAMNNLIRNAIRYARNCVEISISIEHRFCCISIDDDGPGIPKTERQRILQAFTRIDSSRNKKTGGYGLGLSIVQQIIKWHKGEITIASSHYNGASFTIKLPIKK